MNKIALTYNFIGRKSFSWLCFGMFAGLVLALVEMFFSSFIIIILQALGMTTQKMVMPFGLNIQVTIIFYGLLFLVFLGFLRSALYVFTGLSAVVSNEFFQARLKLLSINKVLSSTSEFSSLSKVSSMFAETFNKSALCFHSCAHILPLSMQAVVLFGILLKMSAQYTLIGIGFLALSGTAIVGLQKVIQRVVYSMPSINANLFQAVVRIYKNWFLIKILQIEKEESLRFTELQIDYSTKNIFTGLLALISANLPTAFGILLISSFIFYHQTTHIIENSLFISFLYLFLRFVQLLSQIANFIGIANINFPYLKLSWEFFHQLDQSFVHAWSNAIDRISILSSQSKKLIVEPDDSKNKLSSGVGKDLFLAPAIEINELWFRYDKHLPWIFKGVDLAVEPGKQVVIMGPSGVGKSTFLALIMGIIPSTKGEAKIDGCAPMEYLSKNAASIAYVGADPFLIEGTIKQNLLYGNRLVVSNIDMLEVLNKVDLQQWFSEINSNFDYFISESASTLSTGQKQRLAIARALLRKPKLLILDEISANLDSQTEAKIADTILQFKGIATTIIVTHRLGIAKYSDHIINLEQVKSEGVF